MMTMIMALILGASAPVTLAADAPVNRAEQVRVRLSMAGYDFANPDDVARFDRRTRDALEHLCGTASSADLAGQNDVTQCRDAASALIRNQRDIRIAAVTAARPALARR
ncbi:UrcA family protein [Pseudonocardia sp. TMWB2A]|uniref:UrcA family protein n=1 Tax=Pseudonocardia sp. TMWB2A TaxID=687430 RepID=UPI00307D057F